MDVIESLVEVRLKSSEDFLKVKETLTRIGVASRRDKKLYQSCHILHKRGRFYIVHFKEMFKLDGKQTDFSNEDVGRRNTISNLLEEWNLVEVVEPSKVQSPVAPLSQIKVIPFRDKKDWELISKYTIGKSKR